MKPPLVLILLACAAAPAHLGAQAAVEYATGTARSGASVKGSQALGKAIGSVFERAGKNLGGKPATPPASSTTTIVSTTPSSTTPAAPPKVYPAFEEKALSPGAPLDDIVSRFGPPSIQITNADGTQTAWYETKQQSVEIAVSGGKVVSWRTTPKAETSSSVVVLQ